MSVRIAVAVLLIALPIAFNVMFFLLIDKIIGHRFSRSNKELIFETPELD